MKRYKVARRILIFWCLFIGIGALFGSSCMIINPSGELIGMKGMLPYFQVLPFSRYLFQNLLFSGFALLIVNGITNIIASILLIKHKKIGIILGGIFGVTLMMWITIQFIIFPFNILSTSYFVFGLLQAVTGYACYIFYQQSLFSINESEYKNIGENKKEIVIYFSRMGYTKKIALEEANKRHAEVIELSTNEHTKGTSGFWWCGRFGMLNKPMVINEIDLNLEDYDKVIIVSPIWVFKVCSPINDFCNKYSGKINNVEYIFTHYMKHSFIKEADKLDNILEIKRTKFISICVRIGKVVKKEEY